METNLLKVENSYSKKKRLLEGKLSEYRVLILGSSLPCKGIDPSFFSSSAFNLSNVSQSLYYDSELISKYAPRMPNLKLVIIPIDFYSLEYNLCKSPEFWRGISPKYYGQKLYKKKRFIFGQYGSIVENQRYRRCFHNSASPQRIFGLYG